MAAQPPTLVPLLLMVVGLALLGGAMWAKHVRRNQALTRLLAVCGALCAAGWLLWAWLYLP